jgi:peptidoglycan hydrolase CwlO-like protein
MAVDGMQKDINSKMDIIADLQQKLQEHMKNAQDLRQKAMDEQQAEQDELMREQRENQDSLMKRGAKEVAKRGLFG